MARTQQALQKHQRIEWFRRRLAEQVARRKQIQIALRVVAVESVVAADPMVAAVAVEFVVAADPMVAAVVAEFVVVADPMVAADPMAVAVVADGE